MLTLNYKLDAFLFPLDAYYTRQDKQDSALSALVERIETIVKGYVEGNIEVNMFIDQHLDTLFEFRISALKWLISNHLQVDNIGKHIEKIEYGLTAIKDVERFSVLYENVLFAIRTNKRVVNSLIVTTKHPGSENSMFDLSGMADLPTMSFTGLLNIISLTAPETIASTYVDWLISSLYVEFGIITVFIVQKENLNINDLKINELSSFIANAAQDFGAIAKEIMPPTDKHINTYTAALSDEFSEEQIFLAEQDIELLKKH